MFKVLIFSILVLGVCGSHFRGGFIQWEVVAPLTVNFTISFAWRADAPQGIAFLFGDTDYEWIDTNNEIFYGIDSQGEAYRVFRGSVQHVYSQAGVYYAYWNTCCRVYTVLNSASSDFTVRTLVDLTSPPIPNSPVASIPPLIQIPIASDSSYTIGVGDPQGYECSLSNQQDSSIDSVASVGGKELTVTPGCVLNWDNSQGSAGDKYAVSVSVKQIGSQTTIPLDFIVELVPKTDLPTFEVVPYDPVVVLGKAFTVRITATSGRANINELTLSVLGLAGDATVSPAPGVTSRTPYQVFFTSQATIPGSFSTVLVFTDADGYQSTYTIAYSIIKPIDCIAVSLQNCTTLNDLVYYNFNSDPDADYILSNNCTGSYAVQNGSFSFASPRGPNSVCKFALMASKFNGGETANCTLSTSCPLCGSTQSSKAVCRKDQKPIYSVVPTQSVDKYFNGDVLATVTDADGKIVNTTATGLPPGVSVNPNGVVYVSDRPSLIEGNYSITVTNRDVFGGVATQVINVRFIDVECGSGLSSCGAACYDGNALTCVIGNNQRILCPRGQVWCNNTASDCYDPTQQVCEKGVRCSVGTAICGGGCYNPTYLTCNTATNGGKVLCPTVLGFCGNGCVDPNSVDCINGQVYQKGTQFCNGGAFNPSAYVCVNGFLCPTGHDICGEACYRKSEYTCQANSQLCSVGYELCGTTCFNDEVDRCLDPATGAITPL